MVLIFEDWHWADEASESALQHIVSLISSHPVLILVIYRPDYSSNWGNWSHHTPIILKALDKLGSEDFIKSVLHSDRLPEGIASLVHERTGGNPFFIEEIMIDYIDEIIKEYREDLDYLDKTRKIEQSLENQDLHFLDQNTLDTMKLVKFIAQLNTIKSLDEVVDEFDGFHEKDPAYFSDQYTGD